MGKKREDKGKSSKHKASSAYLLNLKGLPNLGPTAQSKAPSLVGLLTSEGDQIGLAKGRHLVGAQ